jgi:hypothetical protein
MPLKVPPRNDLVQPLADWLDDENQHVGFCSGGSSSHNNDDYGDAAPPVAWIVPKPAFSSVECRKELMRLASLRNCLSESLLTFREAMEDQALKDCQDYHATLLAFEKQGFPSVESEHTKGVINLTWRDAFHQEQLETHHSLVWERVGCLWNVAALQSYEATTTCDLTNKEGCKSAISLFQSASSILSTLQELVEQQDYASVDYSLAMLQFWRTVFKAQAQFVIYKMANLGGTTRQHTTLGYLVQAAASLYNEALELAKDPRLQSELTETSKKWATHCKAQSLVCQARATFHISIEHRLQQEHGLELARLSQCVTQLKECQDFWKSAGQDMAEVQGLMQLAKDRLERARTDNDTIYLDQVPTDLSEIRAQIMVKSDLPLPAAMLQPRISLFEWCEARR